MNNNVKQLKSEFNKIVKMGWITSDKINYGAIGETFEKLVGLTTNDLPIPDFDSIEIKTKSHSKFDYICLFNCVPTGPHYHEIEILKETYGYPDSELKKFNVLNGDVFATKLNKIGMRFSFRLNVYRNENKVKLSVYDNRKQKKEESTYWDFDILEEKLTRKLTYLALVDTEKKIVNGKLLFKYKKLQIYKLKNFDTFIDLLEKGLIKVSFKVGVFKDPKRLGKIHDRGTAFSIENKNINMLFNLIE